MGRIAIFIDGAYLQYMLKDEFNSPRICFRKLVNRMAGGREILRSYYYLLQLRTVSIRSAHR
jgi:hypothetical protein